MIFSGKTTLKAARQIPDRRINPDGAEMRRLERRFQEAVTAALDKLRRDLLRGADGGNIAQVTTQRLNDPAYWQPLLDALTAELRRAAEAGATFGQEQVEALVFGVVKREENLSELAAGEIDWTLANSAAVDWAEQYAAELVRGIGGVTRERIARDVAAWVRNGEPFHLLVQRIQDSAAFSVDRARMIAVTEVTRAFAEGNTAAWRQSRVVQQRRWNTAIDELVCPICAPLNGRTAPLGTPFGLIDNPPAHPRCRCWVTPVVEPPLEEERPATPQAARFVPATSKEEVAERMARSVKQYEFGSLPLNQQNSILRAVEDVLGKRGVVIDELGFQLKRRQSVGTCVLNGRTGSIRVAFQKTALSNIEKVKAESARAFTAQKSRNLSRIRGYMAERPLEMHRLSLAHWEETPRWAVFTDVDDPLEAITRHELYHALDFKLRAGGRGPSVLLRDLAPQRWNLVSEYGSSSAAEFWAELGTAIDMGIPLPDDLVAAFREVMARAE